MKNIILSLLVLTSAKGFAAEEAIQLPEPIFHDKPQSTPYFKLGIGTVGAGFRIPNDQRFRAWDHCLSVRGAPPIAGIVNYRCSLLTYDTDTFPKKYKGLGLNLGALGIDGEFMAYPEITLIFGKEFGDTRTAKWRQIEINTLASLIALTATFSSGSVWNQIVAGVGTIAAIDVTWGF
jgi:hypothetical protein